MQTRAPDGPVLIKLSFKMSSINIYAELLINLRQVTIFATLGSNINGQTSLILSADLNNVTIHHEGETAHLQLPAKVAANATLPLPKAPVTELSFRLPISRQERLANPIDELRGNSAPWCAELLTPTTQICCRACNQVLVERSAVAVWKNLPSENWAEMMDFWHCHKPDHEEHAFNGVDAATASGTQKGYAAGSKLTAKAGVGFVDLCYLLLARPDCCGTYVS